MILLILVYRGSVLLCFCLSVVWWDWRNECLW